MPSGGRGVRPSMVRRQKMTILLQQADASTDEIVIGFVEMLGDAMADDIVPGFWKMLGDAKIVAIIVPDCSWL